MGIDYNKLAIRELDGHIKLLPRTIFDDEY